MTGEAEAELTARLVALVWGDDGARAAASVQHGHHECLLLDPSHPELTPALRQQLLTQFDHGRAGRR